MENTLDITQKAQTIPPSRSVQVCSIDGLTIQDSYEDDIVTKTHHSLASEFIGKSIMNWKMAWFSWWRRYRSGLLFSKGHHARYHEIKCCRAGHEAEKEFSDRDMRHIPMHVIQQGSSVPTSGLKGITS
jgi:hypothetical protein